MVYLDVRAGRKRAPRAWVLTLKMRGIRVESAGRGGDLPCAKLVDREDLSLIWTRPAQLMYAHQPCTMPVWALRHQSHHHLWRPLIRALGETLGRER